MRRSDEVSLNAWRTARAARRSLYLKPRWRTMPPVSVIQMSAFRTRLTNSRVARMPAGGLGAAEVRLVPGRELAHPRIAGAELAHARGVLAHGRQSHSVPLGHGVAERDERLHAVAPRALEPEVGHGERPATGPDHVVRDEHPCVPYAGAEEAWVLEEVGARLGDPDGHLGPILSERARGQQRRGKQRARYGDRLAHQSSGRITRTSPATTASSPPISSNHRPAPA